MIANELHNHASEYNRTILQTNQVEEPPFVRAIECRQTDTLLLKTPQNCYRRGVIEQLYPNAEVTYLSVTRAARATINGLIDGWESGQFTARLTQRGWWCFDMPPGWETYWDRSVLDRCVFQWRSARTYIDKDYQDLLCEVPFEHFEEDWWFTCQVVWDALGLSWYDPPAGLTLPRLSTTDDPRPERWRIKRPWLADLELER